MCAVREQFLVEITGTGEAGRHPLVGLTELNRLFLAWVKQVYHRRVHSETGAAPLARWSAGSPFPLPAPAALAEVILWKEVRTVTKTATVSRAGQHLPGRPALVGRRVELVFDPFDLLTVEVRHRGTPAEPAPTTGIDYARLIEAAHHAGLARQVNYAALATRGVAPGAADITEDVVVNVDDVVTGHGDEQEEAR